MSQTMDNPKMMNVRMSCPATSSVFFQPGYMEQKNTATRKLLPFEDNVGLSEEEEDIMLAQCIRSGMPKVSCLQHVANLLSTRCKNTKDYDEKIRFTLKLEALYSILHYISYF
jgi:hypothetical protein